MRTTLRAIMLTICCISVAFTDVTARAQHGTDDTCSRPVVLELTAQNTVA